MCELSTNITKEFLILHKTVHFKELIEFHIIVNCHFAKIFSTECVHQFTLINAILGFLISANQIRLKYSLLTSSFVQCCNKDVIIYSGTSVLVFIHAICSFISIDNRIICKCVH